MERFGPHGAQKSSAIDKSADDLENSQNSTSEYAELFTAACSGKVDQYVELFRAACTGKLDHFQSLALNLAENEGIGVGDAIEELTLKDGRGSLHAAAGGGNLNVCEYLIETLKLNVDFKDKKGQTPLYNAISSGQLDTFTYLLEKGANADASDDKNYTPLHCAAQTGRTKIITLLLSRGVRVDVACTFGTALLFAAANGHQDAVKVLLDHGANPNNAANSDSIPKPLKAAIEFKSWECMELLLQAGADPNAESYGSTPLVHAAVQDAHADVVTRLLEAGADPNYKIDLGLTALEMAALHHNYQMVGVLFPVTSRIPTYPDWSIAGLMGHVNSYANKMQMEVHMKEKFHQAKSKGRNAFQEKQYHMAVKWFKKALVISSKDPAVLSNVSACYARLGDGINALDYATKCMSEMPEWPKAYYRLGVALNMQKRYDDAAGAFNKGLTLDPGNKDLKYAYMKAVEDRSNSIKVDENNAE